MAELQDRIERALGVAQTAAHADGTHHVSRKVAAAVAVAVAVTRQAIEEIHQSRPAPITGMWNRRVCVHDDNVWPCPTIALFGPAPTDGEE